MKLPFTLATLMVTVALAHPARAACSDRPGTPNQVLITPGAPGQLRLKWHNTAREGAAYWDIAIFRNNKEIQGLTGISASKLRDTYFHEFTGLESAARYCFKVRARTQAGSQGCVSLLWSQSQCLNPRWLPR